MKNKILTNPPDLYNSLYDNIDHNLVLRRGDFLQKNENKKYMVIDLLGTGTFSQVVRCVSTDGEEVAIKIVKNSPKYYFYEMNEVRILQNLMYKNLSKYFVEIKDVFMFKEHLCIVQELLGYNLYEMLKITGFKGFDHKIVQKLGRQLLEGLTQLSLMGITHCDLKPENILIKNCNTFDIKIIDFGSAFISPQQSNFYVQSRYYRSPEVILGIPYSNLCDIWSFGCIIYEIYMGVPIFPGKDNADLLGKIHNFFSRLPKFMLEHGKHTNVYFEKENNYKIIFDPKGPTMNEIIDKIKSKNNNLYIDDVFVSFVLSCLNPSHLTRPSSDELLKHKYLCFNMKNENDFAIRNQPTPIPPISKQRRNSDYSAVRAKKNKDEKRKCSVFNMTNENKPNN
ncbi:ser thr protein kinase (mnb dyrk subfamily) [Vairimorpha apis BRL 01]|uniref:Ser thr protein kinase (Mnb dyrk subfamily) n=1 Tax=Vairimorpha apis BRL 01 TaxID=1037528 RepID=T0LAL7_9MICR|nr:ser thr protein kinase (mnb dyrk subfamily) [Vairimorpha apis BRL 01]